VVLDLSSALLPSNSERPRCCIWRVRQRSWSGAHHIRPSIPGVPERPLPVALGPASVAQVRVSLAPEQASRVRELVEAVVEEPAWSVLVVAGVVEVVGPELIEVRQRNCSVVVAVEVPDMFEPVRCKWALGQGRVPNRFGFEPEGNSFASVVVHCTFASWVPNTSESELEPHSSEFVGERCMSGLGRSKSEPVGDNFAAEHRTVAGKSVAEAVGKIVASGVGHIRHSFVVLPTIVVAVGVGNSFVGCIVLAGPVGGTTGSFAVVVADNCKIVVVVFEVGHIRHNFVGLRRILHKIVVVVRNVAVAVRSSAAAVVAVVGNCNFVVRILQSCLRSSVGDHPTTAAVAVAHSCCRHSSVGVLLHNRRHSSVGRPTIVVAVGVGNNSVGYIVLVERVGGTSVAGSSAEAVDKCTIADVVVGHIRLHRRTRPAERSWRSLVELERSHRRTVPMAHSPTQEGPTESALLAK
jgi:hypothetical protein